MKNVSYFLSTIGAALLLSAAPVQATTLSHDITQEIPLLNTAESHGYVKVDDVAQFKNADWSHAVGLARGVSLEDAYKIANSKPEVTFFFYVKGKKLLLDNEVGDYRAFHRGDAVFFSGDPSWGSAPGAADGYVKCPSCRK